MKIKTYDCNCNDCKGTWSEKSEPVRCPECNSNSFNTVTNEHDPLPKEMFDIIDAFNDGTEMINRWRGDAFQSGDEVCRGLTKMTKAHAKMHQLLRTLLLCHEEISEHAEAFSEIKNLQPTPILRPDVKAKTLKMTSWTCPSCNDKQTDAGSPALVTCRHCGLQVTLSTKTLKD